MSKLNILKNLTVPMSVDAIDEIVKVRYGGFRGNSSSDDPLNLEHAALTKHETERNPTPTLPQGGQPASH